MNGTSGFQEVVSSTSRQSKFWKGVWPLLRTCNHFTFSTASAQSKQRYLTPVLWSNRDGQVNSSLACPPHRRMVLGNYSFLCLATCLFLTFCLDRVAWGAQVSLLAVEVTQGLQAISHNNAQDPARNNTVPLIRGKRTLVRAYLSGG